MVVGDGCAGGGCDDGLVDLGGVSKVIGGMFRGSIIGHGIRSMDATARRKKVVGLSVFTRKRCCSGRRWKSCELGSKRSEKNGNGRTEGDRWKGLLEEEASATRQTNSKRQTVNGEWAEGQV